MKKSAAVPWVMLSHAGRVTKHLDREMTYVRGRPFAPLRMTKQRRFFTSALEASCKWLHRGRRPNFLWTR